MSRRLLTGFAAVAAVSALVASPALAATQKCHQAQGSSATNIYVQQIPGSGSCGKKNNSGGTVPQYVAPTQATTRALKHSHTSRKNLVLLRRIATDTAFGAMSPLHLTAAAERGKPPSTLGAAFDLGSGPTALFGALFAAAVLIALGGGLRQRRR